MSEIDQLFQEFPPGVRQRLRRAWDGMPDVARRPLTRALRELPADLGHWRELVRLALSQARLVTGDKRRVAIVGPANVGKSTLYNQLVRNAEDRAEVSAVPGTTRTSQTADAGLFAVVDTPGADAVGAVGDAEKEQALASAREADLLVVVFDAVQGVKRTELELFRELQALDHPHVVVLNKITSWPGRASASASWGRRPATWGWRPTRWALRREGRQARGPRAAGGGEGRAGDRGRPRRRPPGVPGAAGLVCDEEARGHRGRHRAHPLPILDVVPLLAVQASLLLGIARIYGQRITLARARELVVTFGPGFAGRTAFFAALEAGRAAGVGPRLGHRRLDDGRDRPRRRRLVRWRGAGESLRAESQEPLAREADAAFAPGAGPAPPPPEDVRQTVEAELAEDSGGRPGR